MGFSCSTAFESELLTLCHGVFNELMPEGFSLAVLPVTALSFMTKAYRALGPPS
jgi:hypothetical protein